MKTEPRKEAPFLHEQKALTRNGAQQVDDDVTDDSVVEVGVSIRTARKLDGLEDEGVVEAETVPCDVEGKPRVGSTEEDLAVLPLAKVTPEVGPRCRGNLGLCNSLSIGVITSRSTTVEEGGRILDTLVNLLLDIHGVTGSLGDGQAEVESADGGDAAKTNDDTPDLVKSVDIGLDGALVTKENDESNNGGSEDTEALHGKHSSHHGTTTLGGSEFRSDDGGKRVIATNTDTEDKAPEDDGRPDRDCGALSRESLTNSSDDNDNQFQPVHLLTTHVVSEVAEAELADHGTDRGSDLDSGINVGRQFVGFGEIDETEHDSDQVDRKNIVGIGKEPNARHDTSANVEPSKLGIVNLLLAMDQTYKKKRNNVSMVFYRVYICYFSL